MSDAQLEYWNTAFAGSKYFYGADAGPVARRAVRYHRPISPVGGTAVDFGCGEGQDLVFLAEQGYNATGIEFTGHGISKALGLLAARNLRAEVRQADLKTHTFGAHFDLVLSINALQFLGSKADTVLNRVVESVAPRGVLGLSVFAREEHEAPIENGVFRWTLNDLKNRLQSTLGWQLLEVANLWQWNRSIDRPQAFVTIVAQRLG